MNTQDQNHSIRRRRGRLALLVAGAGATLALTACVPIKGTPPAPPQPQLFSQTFNCTGGAQTFTVPAGVTSIGVDMYGGQGGSGAASINPGSAGGLGGRSTTGLAVSPGESIQVNVGCLGSTASSGSGGPGGFFGGGTGGTAAAGGGGGGGASDVRQGGTALGNRVVIAAGGGGGGGGGGIVNPNPGTSGGHPVGGAGTEPCVGTGGTQTAGGTGGGGGTDGSLGNGGEGEDQSGGAGGGGGGGLYGGSGGDGGTGAGQNPGCGGGGGSSFGPSGATFENGVRSGNGQVIITWLA